MVVPKRLAGARPNPATTGPVDRPLEIAAEGADRQGRQRRPGVDGGEGPLQLVLRDLQLPDVLGREVPLPVEVVDAAVARGHGRIEGGAGAGRGFLRRRHRRALAIEFGHRGAFGGQRAAAGFHAHAVEFGHRGHAPAHAPEGADVAGGEQQWHVAAAPALIEFHQPVGDAWRFGDARGLERRQARGPRVAAPR